MENKKLRMFAGPNGSGKSTLLEEINKNFNTGYFINADKIEAHLTTKKFFDCSEFLPNPVYQETWESFLSNQLMNRKIYFAPYRAFVIYTGCFSQGFTLCFDILPF